MSEEDSDVDLEGEGEENQEVGESEPDEPEPVEPVKEPVPQFQPRREDPLTAIMNLNKELDFLGSQIGLTCT